ncbi:MAG: alpha-mannosidase, partial [Synechococcus sp.]
MNPDQVGRSEWIETFRSRSRRDLRAGWRRSGAAQAGFFLDESWGSTHRPDWAKRGLLIWPRGRQWLRLEQRLSWPDGWSNRDSCRARLVLSWWAEQMRLWVDGVLVHEGDLFDTACRWPLPGRCRQGAALDLVLELCSPLHDDGALISSHLDLEPQTAGPDPEGTLLPAALELHLAADGDLPPHWAELDPSGAEAQAAVAAHLHQAEPPRGLLHWLGHAHLDLAWLWPVADTWQAAERTFRSALALMRRWPELRFAHSTPALYAWMEQHRPALFAEIQAASRAGRWEPINGPWVETDCVLVSTASLWNQFALGQDDSRRRFPEWTHELAWLPDSFGFAAGLPAVASATGVRWFCTHKLAWNADNPFPHRLFRWRARGRSELHSLMLPPIGRRADPVEMLDEQRAWHQATGLEAALWIPGVGDHGGGPTEELLEQIELWEG